MITCGSQSGVVGIVTRLADGRLGNRIPTRERRISLLQNVETNSCTQAASYSVGTNRVVMLTNHLDIVPRLRRVETYLHCPYRLHGVGRDSSSWSLFLPTLPCCLLRWKELWTEVEWGLKGNWLTQSKSPENTLEIRLGEPQTGREPLSSIS